MRIFNKFRGTKGFLSVEQYALRFRDMITPSAQERVRILVFWKKHGYEATHEAFKVSRRTLYRWQSMLYASKGTIDGLNAKKTVPVRRRSRTVSQEMRTRIIALRTAHPRLGKDKVWTLLKNEGYKGSISTVGRIIADLKASGALKHPVRLSVDARSGNLREQRCVRKKKQRRPRGYRVLEVDTVVRFVHGMKRYVLTGVDTESRIAFAAAYTNHGSLSAADFLRRAVEVIPDCPRAVQTDNGSEFALHFDTACASLDLTRFHTYPRSPRMNAHVERFNRTLEEEFLRYHRDLLRDDVAAFNDVLVDWLLWYNGERPHHALGLRSPFCCMMAALPTAECHMWWTHTPI